MESGTLKEFTSHNNIIDYDTNQQFTQTLQLLKQQQNFFQELQQHLKQWNQPTEQLPYHFLEQPTEYESLLSQYQKHLSQYQKKPTSHHYSALSETQQQLLRIQQLFILQQLLQKFIQKQSADSLNLGEYYIIDKDAFGNLKKHLENKELKSKINGLISNNNELNNNKNELELESKINELENKNNELKNKINELENKELESKHSELESKNNELDNKINEMESEINELRNLEKNGKKWKLKLKNLLKFPNKSKPKQANYNQKLQKLQTDYQNLQTDCHNLKTACQNLQTDHQKLQELQTGYRNLQTDHQKLQELQTDHLNLQTDHHNLKTTHQNLQTDYHNLKTTHQNLQTDYHNLKTTHQNLQTDYHNLKTTHQNFQTDYHNLKTTHQNLQTDHQNFDQNFEKNYQESKALLNLKDKEIDYLKKANEKLKKEAIKYQSALGDATSFQLGSQDSNSAGQLSKDIRNLHKNLDKFCGLKKGIEINESEVKELLKKFGCSITDKIRNSKNVISGALERHVIEYIIEKTKNYLEKNDNDDKNDDGKYNKKDAEKHKENDDKKCNKNNSEKDYKTQQQSLESLEVEIVETTEQLLKLTHSISINRAGTEEVSKATSTKLRQQIYGVLGNRGFSNIIVDKENKKHPLIAVLQKDILNLMNRYRTIKNPEKLSEIESIIDEIVRQVVSIFFFRLKVQEPVADWKFFENKTSINTIVMEAPWDENELEDLHVDICAFPIIGSNLCEADKVDENLKVIFPAQIITNNPTRSH
ncbi:890_t:CDS:1 [Entrophospora sp. SA101]|nr:2159_t:CDS:1 [Entrophospora sp. SA101]CAJ0908447.1 890_t:CDS:1 [Entrophospora sp. SA101]